MSIKPRTYQIKPKCVRSIIATNTKKYNQLLTVI